MSQFDPRSRNWPGAAFAGLAARLKRRGEAEETADPPEPSAPPAPAGTAQAEQQTLYAMALQGLPDPVMLVAGDAEAEGEPRLLFVNAAAQELFRLQRASGMFAASLRNPVVLEALDEALYGRVQAEAVFEEGGLSERVWRTLARPLASDGEERLALVVLHDETNARRSERMRADFLANASHELRTPLASLAGFIETLRGHAKEDPAARDRFLAIMAQQADRMSRLIADLLSLSRIELNEHIAPSGAVDLGLAATDVLDALGPVAAEAGVRIEPSLPGPGAAKVVGDRDQIIQVIQNLTENAIKYAGRDGVARLEVTGPVSMDEALTASRPEAAGLSLLTPDRLPNARYAVLRVRDSGPGIAREHLPRLSERFYRVEGQKSGERSGTGLGLAIVKHIVNRHRGGLAVESVQGEGSTFIAYFPVSPP